MCVLNMSLFAQQHFNIQYRFANPLYILSRLSVSHITRSFATTQSTKSWMRAAFYTQVGPAQEVLQIGEVEKPEVGPNEVSVRVHFSAVNPSDVKKRAGQRGDVQELIVPHSDGSGVIETIGDKVDPAWLNAPVWVYNAQHNRNLGTAAECVILPLHQVSRIPNNVDLIAGACLGIPAMTAHRCLFADGPITDQTILVTGGAGAVGSYAIQLAKWGRAKQVITTVSSHEKAVHARNAGADYVINYHESNTCVEVKNILEETHSQLDRIVDVSFGSNLDLLYELLKPNGTVATYASLTVPEPKLSIYPLMFKNITIQLVFVYDIPQAAKVAACKDIEEALTEGALHLHNIEAVYPLHEIAKAHDLAISPSKSIGKVLVNVL